jgi:hypothetical protein
VAAPLAKNELELEGHKLAVVNTGQTDTAYSTSLHVPSIGLINCALNLNRKTGPAEERADSRVTP